MSRHLENTDDPDKGCGCGHNSSDDWDDNGGDDSGDWNGGGDGDAADWGDDDSTVPCPYCGQEVYEDSPRCPHCGRYISEEDSPPRRMPWWVILGIVLCFCAIVVWIIGL
jgi:endogenous inhibitor of DNA gyrase (YacG/DUF329 family)